MRAILFALLLSTPALADVGTTPMDDTFIGFAYGIDSGGDVQIYASPRNASSKLAICGIVVFDKATATTRTIERRFTERVSFMLAGAAVHVQTDIFKRYKSIDEARAANLAGCSISNQPWDDSYSKAKFDMDLGATTITY